MYTGVEDVLTFPLNYKFNVYSENESDFNEPQPLSAETPAVQIKKDDDETVEENSEINPNRSSVI